MARIKKHNAVAHTSAQQLASLLKSARDIMRKDKGLSTDIDRLPLLTWLMFLKFIDDLEIQEEAKAVMGGHRYAPLIAEPYRWRDWAGREDGYTGDNLLRFVNSEETRDLSGKKIEGLIPYLRALRPGPGPFRRRRVIASIFKDVTCRMLSGHLLRDVVNKINGIHFTAKEELFTLGHIYESMLKEMRDAAGENGEFYTPRPVVKFIVQVIDPKKGETVLDPACGTGGFLAEAFAHIEEQCETVEDRRILQNNTIQGGEPKPLPFLLCQMNLLLHGMEAPEISPENSLAVKLSDIGERDRSDVILTNPPFGGEEEDGIKGGFPPDLQTSETALLFLQLIMRKLRSRAAVIVNDGLLSTKGVCARVKQLLTDKFNLHTIVRLPRGVFSPYTPIKTNILFFEKSPSYEGTWYWEIPAPVDRQMYTKTKPLGFDAFSGCLSWWERREPNNFAWFVPKSEIASRGYDLDIPNPNREPDYAELKPSTLLDSICVGIREIATQTNLLNGKLASVPLEVTKSPREALSAALQLRKKFITISDDVDYKLLTVQLHGRGLKLRGVLPGSRIKTKKQQVVRHGDLVVAEIDAKMGGFGIVPPDLDGSIVSSHYFVYEIDEARLTPKFLEWFIRSGLAEAWIQPYVKGSTNYASIRQNHFPLLEIRMPEIGIQREFVQHLDRLRDLASNMGRAAHTIGRELDALVPALLLQAFNGEKPA